VWDDAVNFVAFVLLVFLWRGGWNLNERFIIPEKELGGWVNHVIGLVVLMATGNFSVVGSAGVVIDGEGEGEIVFFPIHYIRANMIPSLHKRVSIKRGLKGGLQNPESEF
jgi:hypothetical protein